MTAPGDRDGGSSHLPESCDTIVMLSHSCHLFNQPGKLWPYACRDWTM